MIYLNFTLSIRLDFLQICRFFCHLFLLQGLTRYFKNMLKYHGKFYIFIDVNFQSLVSRYHGAGKLSHIYIDQFKKLSNLRRNIQLCTKQREHNSQFYLMTTYMQFLFIIKTQSSLICHKCFLFDSLICLHRIFSTE